MSENLIQPADPEPTPAPPAPAPEAHETLLQEIVDFLHRLFPAHNAPGTPTV